MRRFHSIAILPLVVGFLASCAVQDVKPDYKLKPEGPKGLLAVSFTYHGGAMGHLVWRVRPVPKPGTAPGPSTNAGTDPMIVVFGMSGANQVNVDWPPPIGAPVPASRRAGRVAVIEMSPGSYDLYRWEGSTPGYVLSSGAKPLVIRFKVEAGKATYIGNVHMFWENPSYRVGVFDTRDRDFPLIKKKVPSLTDDQIVVALAELEKSNPPPGQVK